MIFLAAFRAPAQEALQNMQAGIAAANSRAQQMQSVPAQDYTFKDGDFRFLASPSLGLEYNDNVNLAKTDAMDDFIVTPAVGLTASYPWSQRNLLYLNFTVGYQWYLRHSQFSTFELNSSSRTGLSFDFAIKDFTIDLHDWVSYLQGAGQYGAGGGGVNGFAANTASAAVANTATYGTFQNTAGISGSWDLNQAQLSVGYDHLNLLSTTGQYDSESHSAEMFFARAGFDVLPQATVGLESTASFTTYDQNLLNDNDAYTVGPYLEFRPGRFLTVNVRGGFETYQFENTSAAIQTASQNGWYAGVTIAYQPTDFLTCALAAGREVQLGVQSDMLEDWYVRPNVTWLIIKGLDLNANISYEHGDQGVGSTGSLAGSANGTFDWYGGGLSLQHALTSRLTLGLNYQITLRSSGVPSDSYTQNLVALQLTYSL
ncbi:MAG: outer membrane beta-barrel protein [Verrucomicrobiota bacterium]